MCSLRLLWRKNEGRGFVMLGIGSCDVEKDGKERGGAGEEAASARARRVETAPSEKEVEARNLDHGVFRSWLPRYVKG